MTQMDERINRYALGPEPSAVQQVEELIDALDRFLETIQRFNQELSDYLHEEVEVEERG